MVEGYVIDGEMYCEDCGSSIPDAGMVNVGCESDTPQHCGECGCLLTEELTEYGKDYVLDRLVNYDGDPVILLEWAEAFNFDVPRSFGTDHYDADAVRAWVDVVFTASEALASFDDYYEGKTDDLGEWARQAAENLGYSTDVTPIILKAVDWEAVAENLKDSYTIWEREGTYYIFYTY